MTIDHGDHNQSGDHTSRDAAGGSIYHGVDLDAVGRFLEGARHASDAMLNAMEHLRRDLEMLHNETRYYLELEASRWLAQSRQDALIRHWLAALTVAMLVCAVVVAALIYREAVTLAALNLYATIAAALDPLPRGIIR